VPSTNGSLVAATEASAAAGTGGTAFWNSIRPYGLALAIYLASRLVIVLAILVASAELPLWRQDLWQSGQSWYDHLLRWDSEWYAGIAANGYRYSGVPDDPNDLQPVVFFPLFPLLSRLLAQASGISPAHALLVVANAAALPAVLLFYMVARRACGERVALLSVAFFSFFPGSLFLSAGYAEPLALLFVLLGFALLQDARFLPASVCGGLAGATRAAGIVLTPVLLWELWRKYRHEPARFILYAIPCLAVASAGVWLYMIYLGAGFGHPLALSEAQSAWHGVTSPGERLFGALTLQPLLHFRFTDFSPAGLDQWFFVLLLAGSVLAWVRLSASCGVFSVGVLMMPYLSLSGGPLGLTSMTRYGVLAFPAFIALADICQKRFWLCAAIIGIFGGLLALYAALFGQWYWVD
jgi:hypothetical protein